MIITALLENTTTHPCMLTEHGLSLHIRTAAGTVLFDMGQSDYFAQNANTLGIGLSDVDAAVLSHGHYDHGGGLATFLACNDHAPVYVNRHAWEPHYNGQGNDIGLSPALSDSPRLHFVDDCAAVSPQMTLFSMNDKDRLHPLGAFGLTVKENGVLKEDDFRHEQYLLIEENGKRVLISGCSHKGIVDITRWFEPDVLIGGFHLSKLTDEEQLEAVAAALSQHHTTYYTCHCTGDAAFAFLQNRLPRLHYLSCGDQLIL